MLSRALTRSPAALLARLGASGNGASALFANSSRQWNRSISNNKRHALKGKSAANSAISSSSLRKSTNSLPATSQGSASESSLKTPYTGLEGEVSRGANSVKNTQPIPEAGHKDSIDAQQASEQEAYSTRQNEFETAASPAHNTNPGQDTMPGPSESPSTPLSHLTGSEQSDTVTGPLPDLTKGIPSTLEYELEEARRRADIADGKTTDDDTGSTPRAKGELPASAYISSTEKKRAKVANYLYASFVLFLATGYTYLGRNWETEEEEKSHFDAPSGWSLGLMWARVKARMSGQLSYYQEPAFKKLLPDPDPSFERPYTLVLSLEDLLIHSEWSREHGWRMAKRPGVDYFLRYLSQYYELVIFTTVPWAMGDPVIKKLDPYHIVTWPLFREASNYKNGEYVKDLSYLNRDLAKVILIDTKAAHAQDQPENAIILPPWEGAATDKDLVSLIPFLEYVAIMSIADVRKALKSFEGKHIPTEFAKREAVARQKFQAQLAAEKAKQPKSGLGWMSSALGVNKPMMTYEPGEQSPAEAFAQGKMLQDIARERGQRNYEALEKMIREDGEKWLKEEAAAEEAAKAEGMKMMKNTMTGYIGGGKGESKSATA